MNNSFCLMLMLGVIGCDSEGRLYDIEATYYFINETSESVKSEKGCGRSIISRDTLIYQEVLTIESFSRPDIDNYTPLAMDACLMAYEGDASKCEGGIFQIENYENRKEVAPLQFEFTFRFTESKKLDAGDCNLPCTDCFD